MDMSLLAPAAFNLILEYVYKLLALFVLWASLRLLERFNGRPWSNTIARIEENPIALSHYQCAVWLGCALVLAS